MLLYCFLGHDSAIENMVKKNSDSIDDSKLHTSMSLTYTIYDSD